MTTDNPVSKLLKEFAKENKFDIFDCKFGSIEFDPSAKKFNIALNGNVYGIWVKLSAKSKLKLWNEVRDKSLKSFIENIVDFKPIIEINENKVIEILDDQWYPLYWGKDLQGAQRIFAHMKGHESAGNINMPKIETLKNVQIIYGSITVSDYVKFEKKIIQAYRPLLGTRRKEKVTEKH